MHQPEPGKLKNGLEKSLSLAEATVYGLGIIFGAGIYVLIGEAAGIAGNSMWISFVLAAVIASFTALSYCELSSMFPKSAAEYSYVKNAFNSNVLGFLMGWISIFVTISAISTVSLGFAGYLQSLAGVPLVLGAVSLIAVLSIVNFLGVKESTRLTLVLTSVTVLGLVLIIFFGLPFLGTVDYFSSVSETTSLFDFIGPVATAAALIFFAYIGFEDIANISEETVNAKNAVPKAIILSLVISTILYILVSVSVVSIVPWQELAQSHAPISLVAETVFGPVASTVFGVIALFATASTVIILLVAVSRLFYGMSSDHSLPNILSSVHSKTKAPFVAIALTSIIAMLFVLVGDLKEEAFITTFTIFALFFFVNLSAIVLRFTQPGRKRPFRIWGSVARVPVVPLFGLFASVFMMSRIELGPALFATSFILLGVPAYAVLKIVK